MCWRGRRGMGEEGGSEKVEWGREENGGGQEGNR